MKWEKLNNKSLEKLKEIDGKILVFDPVHRDYRIDVIEFIDLKYDMGYSEEEMKHCWDSLQNKHSYEYSDDELIDLFSHYCVISYPDKSKDEND